MTAACTDTRHATERFCPTCGAWRGADAGRRTDARRLLRRLGALGAGCVVLGAIGLGSLSSIGMLPVTDGPTSIDEREPTDPAEVTLPDRAGPPAGPPSDDVVVTEDAGGATADDAVRDRRHVRDTGAESLGIATCVPRGCVRWERHVDGLLAADDAAVHVVDERQVRTYDAVDGTLRWRRPLLDPLPADAAPDGFATYPAPVAIDARQGTVVTASARHIVVLNADGTRRWTAAPRHDGATASVRLVADGHVLTVTRAEESRPAPVRVAVLDADTGSERWARSFTSVVAVDDGVVTVLDADGVLAGLGVSDGRLRWRRATSRDPSGWPPLIDHQDAAASADPGDGPDGGGNGHGNGHNGNGDADDAVRRRAVRADLASYDALIVGFEGGSATIHGSGPEVVLDEPTVVVVGDRLLGIGHDG